MDDYALGAILYRLLGSRAPFSSSSALETMRMTCEEPLLPLRTLHPGVPRDLEAICHKCLEKNPVARYPSAEALSDDLGRFLRGEPTRVRPQGPLQRGWMWARRRPAAAALIATGG